MTDEFVTQALQQDRYLKAIELIDRFETEIERLQNHTGKRIVEENQELFVDDLTPDFRSRRNPSTTFAFARTDFKMSRFANEEPDANRLKMSLMIHWNDATVLGHDEGYGALAVASLRIKNLSKVEYQEIKRETLEEGWNDIQFGEDPFNNSPGIIYSPVETIQDIDHAHERFAAHFRKYGQDYGKSHRGT
ncbi:hypothetical protein JCM17823_23800 [Halorubrum gandharaense]